MALDVYFKEDVLNVLRATYVAGEGPATLVAEMLRDPELQNVPLDKLLGVYRRGFVTALGAIGLAFGIEPTRTSVEREQRTQAQQPPVEHQGTSALYGASSRRVGPGTAGELRSNHVRDEFDLTDFLWTHAQYEKQSR